MNNGKVHHTLINKINNNLVKIIQYYNVKKTYISFLTELIDNTHWIKCNLNHQYKNSIIHIKEKEFDYWIIFRKNNIDKI